MKSHHPWPIFFRNLVFTPGYTGPGMGPGQGLPRPSGMDGPGWDLSRPAVMDGSSQPRPAGKGRSADPGSCLGVSG